MTRRLLGTRLSAGSALEGVLVALAAAALMHLVQFKGVTPIYSFNSNSGAVWLDEATRVVDGEVMYRDFFEFVPPGVVYLNAAVMRVFGARIAAFGYLAVALGTLLTVLTHRLAVRLVGPGWRLLAPALFATTLGASDQIGDHKALTTLFGLTAVLLATPARSAKRLFAVGACAGAAILCTTDIGMGMAAGLFCGLARDRVDRRGLAAFALGCSIPVGGVMGWFCLKAGLGTVLYDTILFPITHYRRANPFVVFLDLGALRVAPRTLTRLALGLGCLASAFMVIRRPPGAPIGGDARRESVAAALRLGGFAGLGFAVAELQRSIYPLRLAAASALLIVPLVATLEDLSRGAGLARRASRALCCLLVLGSCWSSLGLVYRRQWERTYAPEAHRAGTVLPLVPLPQVTWIEENTRPGDVVFAFPSLGGSYFLSQTRNATSFSRLELGGLNPPEHVARALSQIQEHRPAVGILQEIKTLPSFQTGFSLDLLYTGIRRSYKCEAQTDNGVFLLRRRDATGVTETEPC
jgi:hypothetical protein